MEESIFSFHREIVKKSMERMCPRCQSPTVEVITLEYPAGPTGIYRCMSDDCDTMHVPTMPEIVP
jgi:hypothetical protein